MHGGLSSGIGQWQANLSLLEMASVQDLRRLRVCILVENNNVTQDILEQVKQTCWKSLPIVLGRFKSLEEVVVIVKDGEESCSEIWQEIHEHLCAGMPAGIRLSRRSDYIL
jgi:hypothetical protein